MGCCYDVEGFATTASTGSAGRDKSYLVLADEPTGNLDTAWFIKLFLLMREVDKERARCDHIFEVRVGQWKD